MLRHDVAPVFSHAYYWQGGFLFYFKNKEIFCNFYASVVFFSLPFFLFVCNPMAKILLTSCEIQSGREEKF